MPALASYRSAQKQFFQNQQLFFRAEQMLLAYQYIAHQQKEAVSKSSEFFRTTDNQLISI